METCFRSRCAATVHAFEVSMVIYEAEADTAKRPGKRQRLDATHQRPIYFLLTGF